MALKNLVPWTWNRSCAPVPNQSGTDRSVSSLHRHINSLFDDFWQGSRSHAWREDRGFTPSIDVKETEDTYTVRAELPGLTKDDVQLDVHDQVLTIQGEKHEVDKDDKNGVRYRESRFGRFVRRIALPKGTQTDQVTATVQDGVLTVTIPKIAEAKPTRIAVN